MYIRLHHDETPQEARSGKHLATLQPASVEGCRGTILLPEVSDNGLLGATGKAYHHSLAPEPPTRREEELLKLEEAFLRQEQQLRDMKATISQLSVSRAGPAHPLGFMPGMMPQTAFGYPGYGAGGFGGLANFGGFGGFGGPGMGGGGLPTHQATPHAFSGSSMFSHTRSQPSISRPPGFDAEDINIEEALAAAKLPAFPGCDEALRNLLTSWYFAGYYAGKFGATIEDLSGPGGSYDEEEDGEEEDEGYEEEDM